jgi:hypothetical protein
MYEPPKIDRKNGIVYFDCPEWADCEQCPVNCAFNPNTKPSLIRRVWWHILDWIKEVVHIPYIKSEFLANIGVSSIAFLFSGVLYFCGQVRVAAAFAGAGFAGILSAFTLWILAKNAEKRCMRND